MTAVLVSTVVLEAVAEDIEPLWFPCLEYETVSMFLDVTDTIVNAVRITGVVVIVFSASLWTNSCLAINKF